MIGASSIAFPLVLPRLPQSAAALPPSSSQKNPSLVCPRGKMALFRLNVLYTAGGGWGAAVDPLSPKTQKGGGRSHFLLFLRKGLFIISLLGGSIPKERGRVGTGWTDGGERGNYDLSSRTTPLSPHILPKIHLLLSRSRSFSFP